jgi:hypothetical protein
MGSFQRLEEHGFTVLVLPNNWSFRYPPQHLHDELIVAALERLRNLPVEKQRGRPSGYDHELAGAVMDALNEVFPHSLALIELKYEFFEEPSDEILSTVLNALRGDGHIDGARVLHGKPKLNPLERITLTTEGRGHLEDEMNKRSKTQHDFSIDETSSFILKQLLSEFRDRGLNMTDLHEGYEGLTVIKLKEAARARGITDVDFDLALQDLESSKLIKSGPMDVASGSSRRGVLIVPLIYSKREYLCLTSNGYKRAAKLSAEVERVKAEHPESGGRPIFHGDQYNVYAGQVAAIGPHSTGTVNYQQQWNSIQNQVDLNALSEELEQLRKHLQQSASSSSDYQRLTLLSEAEEHAKKHDGSKAMELLSKVGNAALNVAKDIGTEIAAKVIAKSMGIEP